jgi:hypothetical protein
MPSGVSIAFTIDYDDLIGFERIAATSMSKWYENLAQKNTSLIRVFASNAESAFRASIVRPQESGERPDKRATGKFGFGTSSGGAFIGKQFKEFGEEYGFGYPNIQHADSVTGGLWRVLEYGLSGHTYQHPFAGDTEEDRFLYPEGTHRGPPPRRPSRDIFIPARKEPISEFIGLRPKRFIRDAAEVFQMDVVRIYEESFSKNFVNKMGRSL